VVDRIDMEDAKVTRPPVWVFGVLFLAYLGAHVALLLFIYAVAPSTSSFLAESGAIAGGAAAAATCLLACRPTLRPEQRWAPGPHRRA
jgi:hypothetical protein